MQQLVRPNVTPLYTRKTNVYWGLTLLYLQKLWFKKNLKAPLNSEKPQIAVYSLSLLLVEKLKEFAQSHCFINEKTETQRKLHVKVLQLISGRGRTRLQLKALFWDERVIAPELVHELVR